ncbi:MAG: hypothetical protein HC893_15925 [Chloroflexaceae bacterium]|nr:hypothetical protein [Chloroflexaceae bacterium]
MRFLIALLEIPIVIFASWTVAYHAWLVLNLPAGRIVLPFLLLLGALLWIFWRRWWSMLQPMPADRRLLLGTALLAGATGLSRSSTRAGVWTICVCHRSSCNCST